MSPYDHGQQLFHDMMPKFASGYEFGSEEWVECSSGWDDARNEQLTKRNVDVADQTEAIKNQSSQKQGNWDQRPCGS